MPFYCDKCEKNFNTSPVRHWKKFHNDATNQTEQKQNFDDFFSKQLNGIKNVMWDF